MRNLLFIIFIISLSSCNLIYLGQREEDYYCECPYTFENLVDAENFCEYGIIGTSDLVQYGIVDYWASPEQTLNSMLGDTEDQAILFAYIARKQFGENPELICITRNSARIMYVRIGDSEYLNVVDDTDWDVYKTYEYEQAIWIATHTHGEGPLGKDIADPGL